MRQFVAFRVAEIQKLTQRNEWRWIPSKTNVANEATKWQRRPDFTPSARWFRGPDFLYLEPTYWPTSDLTLDQTVEYATEMKTVGHHNIVRSSETVNIDYFSSWRWMLRAQLRLIRCAYVLRAKIRKQPILAERFTMDDIERAESDLFKRAQNDWFPTEFALLNASSDVMDIKSDLMKFSPYADQNGVLRVQGRIDAAQANVSVQRPIILPRHHIITTRLLEDLHTRFQHINTTKRY